MTCLEPGNPAGQARGEGAAVWFVRFAELTAERGLFVEDHEKIGGREADRRILQEQQRSESACLAQKHSEYADVHGMANVPVEGGSDEKFRRSDGCRSAQASSGELPGTVEIDSRPRRNGDRAKPGKRPSDC
jgi:hypothetical protein